MSEKPTHFAQTKYGFEFGAATVERLAMHENHVYLRIKTSRETLDVRVTPSGLIRTHKPEKPKATK